MIEWDGIEPLGEFGIGDGIDLTGPAGRTYNIISGQPGMIISQSRNPVTLRIAHDLQRLGLVEWVKPKMPDMRHGWYVS